MKTWEKIDSILGICIGKLTIEEYSKLIEYIQNCEYDAYDEGYSDGIREE